MRTINSKENRILEDGSFSLELITWDDDTVALLDATYLKGDGALEIPEDWRVIEICDGALWGCENLISLTANNVKKIGDEVLGRCKNLETLKLPNLTHVGDRFLDFTPINLNTLEIPRLKEIGEYGLQHCLSLTTFNAPCLKKAGGYLLEGSGIETAHIPALEFSGHALFMGCDKLREFEAPGLEETGTGLLMSCNSLISVNAPKLRYAGPQLIAYCENLTTAELPSLMGAGEDAFEDCHALKTLTLSRACQVKLDSLLNNPELKVHGTAAPFPDFHFSADANTDSEKMLTALGDTFPAENRQLALILTLCVNRVTSKAGGHENSIPQTILWFMNNAFQIAAFECTPARWAKQSSTQRSLLTGKHAMFPEDKVSPEAASDAAGPAEDNNDEKYPDEPAEGPGISPSGG